jgi:hypothetical protein
MRVLRIGVISLDVLLLYIHIKAQSATYAGKSCNGNVFSLAIYFYEMPQRIGYKAILILYIGTDVHDGVWFFEGSSFLDGAATRNAT